MLEFIFSEKNTQSMITILSLFLVYLIFTRISKRIIQIKSGLKTKDLKKHKTITSLVNNIAKYFLIVLGIIMVLSIHGFNTSSLIASLGVASAVFALAFQDTVKDLFTGIFIILEDQYNIGDTVKINDFKGEVISVGLRTTVLRSITGENCFITNRNINSVINYSKNKALAVVNVDVSYDTDLDKVEKVLNNLFVRLESEIPEIIGKMTIDGIDDLGESGITFRVTAEVKPTTNFIVERKLRKEIKKEFDKHNIEIPFKQVVIHND